MGRAAAPQKADFTATCAENRCSALGRVAKEDVVDLVSISSRAESLTHGAIIEELRDRSEGAQVRLELILRHDEEHDEFHRSIIERIELDPGE